MKSFYKIEDNVLSVGTGEVIPLTFTVYILGQEPVELVDFLASNRAAYDSQAYSRQRQAAYAALNQFEMQFDDAANSTTTWIDAINAIKQEFPK